jgi:hypothetical protein
LPRSFEDRSFEDRSFEDMPFEDMPFDDMASDDRDTARRRSPVTLDSGPHTRAEKGEKEE